MSEPRKPNDADRELARRIRQGGDEALTQLADALRGPLFAAAYAELRHYDDAQDAAANAFLRICRALPTLREPERVRAWATQIARREAQRLRRRTPGLPDHAPADSPDPTLRLDVARALRGLPGEQARAVWLHYLEGLGVAATAHALGRPEGTVKFWLHRGRAHLRNHLKGYEPMETTADALQSLVIVGDSLPVDLLARMTEACRDARWGMVRHNTALSPLRRPLDGNPELAPPFTDCGCVVLDETVSGGLSAFEWILLFRATAHGKSVPVLLLLDVTRAPAGADDHRPFAAYLAGFDMCLYRPFDLAEFRTFAARLRTPPTEP